MGLKVLTYKNPKKDDRRILLRLLMLDDVYVENVTIAIDKNKDEIYYNIDDKTIRYQGDDRVEYDVLSGDWDCSELANSSKISFSDIKEIEKDISKFTLTDTNNEVLTRDMFQIFQPDIFDAILEEKDLAPLTDEEVLKLALKNDIEIVEGEE